MDHPDLDRPALRITSDDPLRRRDALRVGLGLLLALVVVPMVLDGQAAAGTLLVLVGAAAAYLLRHPSAYDGWRAAGGLAAVLLLVAVC